MNPVTELLLRNAEKNPLPHAHTSSHWRHHRLDKLSRLKDLPTRTLTVLRGSSNGTDLQARNALLSRALTRIERWSYWKMTRGLTSWPEVWKTAKGLTKELQIGLSRHEWSSAVILATLVDHFQAFQLQPKTFALIGDGDGFLGTLILRYFRNQKIRMVNIDLPLALVLQASTHEAAHPKMAMSALLPDMQDDRHPKQAGVTFVHPDRIEQIDEPIDCAINVASMQEMPPSSIEAYFLFLRRCSTKNSRFYCVNRLEKKLVGGEILKFYHYPWRKDDRLFIDGVCPYFVHFLEFQRSSRGPHFLGTRIPFLNYYNGPVMHRLVHLAPADESSEQPT